jgi:hypothetical protein
MMHLGLQYQGKLRKFADAFTNTKLAHLNALADIADLDRKRAGALRVAEEAKVAMEAAQRDMESFMNVERLPQEKYYHENGAGV